jgi:fumarate reductase flavoprotein subunit
MEKRPPYLINRREFLTASTLALASPALVKASADSPSPKAASRRAVEPAAKHSADLAIIGGGGSGLAAAVAAAEQGVERIVVLETLNVLGGNSVNPYGLFLGESKVFKEKRTGMKMSSDEAFKSMMDFGRWRLNAPLVRSLIDGSGPTVDWLAEQGVDFGLMPSPPGSPQNRSGGSISVKFGGVIVQALVKRSIELGVQTLRHTRAKRFTKDRDGRITGVLAEQENGNIEVSAKSFIIATGGFAGNRNMIRKYLPPFQEADDLFVGGIPHEGDGIRMAEEVGAGLEPRGATEISVARFPESPYLPFIVRQQSVLLINKKGKRIADNKNNIWRQPGKTAYIMFDEKMKQTFYEQEISESEAKVFGTWPWLKKKGLLTDIWVNAERDLHSFAKEGKVKITHSWDEMAEWIGSSPDVLRATINEYNAGCDSGKDLFCKDKRYLSPLRQPPYYGIKSTLNLLVTHGVIKTNKRMEVMDSKDDPIPGLYVAGDDIGGVDEDVYGAVGGHSCGFALTSGRLAGLNAASFLAKG